MWLVNANPVGSADPEITWMEPSQAAGAAVLTIIGSGFGESEEEVRVEFGERDVCGVEMVKAHKVIRVRVPPWASGGASVGIRVLRRGHRPSRVMEIVATA